LGMAPWRWFKSLKFWRRVLVVMTVAAAIGIVIGVIFGVVAGVAAFLVAVMIPMLTLGESELDSATAIGANLGRERFGEDADTRRK
jgi:MFS superfamily sulfate permease-like transporter